MKLHDILLVGMALTVTGCSTLSYYSQAVSGHLKLMNARQDVQDLLASDDTDEKLKLKLKLAQEIRAFASLELGLPDNDSYKTYVETGRSYVTWNVVATEEFSVSAKTWCFPVAGCVSYKGYFAEQAAQSYAEELKQQGLDTTVNGATAYSTLGWFDDPLLDIMLRGHEIRLAALIFHELAHQKLYVKGDSDFNEAYASFVEQQGVRAWLKASGRHAMLQTYADLLQRRSEFSDLLLSTREELQVLYESDISDREKRIGKQAAINTLRASYAQIKARWNGYSGYDKWFAKEINNARLVATATYRRLVPAFVKLFEIQGGDFNAFYNKTKELSELDRETRETYLVGLVKSQ